MGLGTPNTIHEPNPYSKRLASPAVCCAVIDNCATQPCGYIHQCENGIDTYTCTCLEGWTGATCDTGMRGLRPQLHAYSFS